MVLAKMNEREIQTLGNYMSALGDVDEEVMDSVKKEFYELIEMGGGGVKGRVNLYHRGGVKVYHSG